MCATEIRFITMLMDELGVVYPRPSTLYEDNTGAIFILKNDQVGQRTKHIDIKWHHVRDMIKDGDLDVQYVRSDDNPSDIMTKNSKEVLYVKHVASMKNGVLVLGTRNREDVAAFAEVVRRSDEARRSDEV